MGHPEIGATKLVTIVSGVEALARSLLVHHRNLSEVEIMQLYEEYKFKKPESLVAEYLKTHGNNDCSTYYQKDTWTLFQQAVNFRNLIVHECTYLGQDKYPSLIVSCEEVLSSLIKLGMLRD